MNSVFRYLTTDVELISRNELTALAESLRSQGFSTYHVTHGEDGIWYATFKTDGGYDEPEPNIARILTVVESLGMPLRSVWNACTTRELNIGYDCGAKPWGFNQVLSPELLGRVAAAGALLRITLYADKSP